MTTSRKRKHRQITLPNGLKIYHLDAVNTDSLYREFFRDDIYLQHGITIDENDVIFDIGANIGFFTLYLNQLRRHTTIYAFEPIPEIFECFKLNAERHNRHDLHMHNCGLSREAGAAVFTYYPRTATSSTMYPDHTEQAYQASNDFIVGEMNATLFRPLLRMTPRVVQYRIAEYIRRYYQVSTEVKCELKTISDIIDQVDIQRIDLLKVDAESSELDILLGIRPEHWPRIRQLIVEIHQGQDVVREIQELVASKGYAMDDPEPCPMFPTMYLLYARRAQNGWSL